MTNWTDSPIASDTEMELANTLDNLMGHLTEFSSSVDQFSKDIEAHLKKKPEEYKFNEIKILQEIEEYIDSTYFSHYAKNGNKVQTTELICSDLLRGLHFCLGNAMKYSDRYGFKGIEIKDLYKAAHYIVMAIDCAQKLKDDKNETE